MLRLRGRNATVPSTVRMTSEAKRSSPAEPRNRSIQGLRGLAASAVLVFHIQMMGSKGEFWNALPIQHWLHEIGPIAVRLFFFISGYLIVGSLWKSGDLNRFATNRVLRIYPVFLLLHLIMFTLGPLANYEWVGGREGDTMGRLLGDPVAWTFHFLSNLLFLPGLFALPIAQQNAWSLSYEALFYLLAAFMFIAWQRKEQLRGRIQWWLGWTIIFSFCLYDADGWFFLTGVTVWWLQETGKLKLPNLGPLDLVSLASGFAIFHTGHKALSALVLSLFFVMVVLEQGWSRKLLQSRAMNFLGTISYSIYLVHPFALEALRRVLHHGTPHGKLVQGAPWLFWIVGPLFAIGCAWLSYELIEKRFTRWISAKLELRRQDLAAKSAPDLMATR